MKFNSWTLRLHRIFLKLDWIIQINGIFSMSYRGKYNGIIQCQEEKLWKDPVICIPKTNTNRKLNMLIGLLLKESSCGPQLAIEYTCSSLIGRPIHSALCHIKAKRFVNYNRPSGFWPCDKSCLVGGSDKYLAIEYT